ncbi:MAG: lysophospholipid acyltransferase family protein, partial [Anaerolineales bacterium]
MGLREWFTQSWNRFQEYLIMLPWNFISVIMRILYDFRTEGMQNVPKEGAYILLVNEFGMICFLLSGWGSIMLLKDRYFKSPDNVLSYSQEELFAFSYFRKSSEHGGMMRALIPHSAGRLAFSLVEGYKTLLKGGIVSMNPEGDMPWDGHPLPIASGAAWLGLHTGAPLLPMVASASAYDIWPRWRIFPSLRGKIVLRYGEPFKLSETAQEHITEQDLQQANARIRSAFDDLRYGEEGLTGWIGSARKNGTPLQTPVELKPRPELVKNQLVPHEHKKQVWRKGIALVLWRCPVCGTNDALIHKRPLLRSQSVVCQACNTTWKVSRVIGKDFRLVVDEGPSDLVGLNMALSTWYDQIRQNFKPTPTSIPGIDLAPNEEVYLEMNGVDLSPHKPNQLFDAWDEREPPKIQPAGKMHLADWPSIGK